MLNSLERRFGGLTFHGLLKWITGFQMLSLILYYVSPGFENMMFFNGAKILAGEYWRVISWLFLPRYISFLFLIFGFFMFFISNVLEESFGAFRVNVFIFSTVALMIVAAFLPFAHPGFWVNMSLIFGLIMIMAAACMAPNYEIMLFGIIPIKMKWIGIMDAAILVSIMIQNMSLIPVLVSLLPFLLGIFPLVLTGMKNNAQASVRRAKFQREAEIGEQQSFHTCKECGITDAKDPHMEFRVSSDDGEEYCAKCLEQQKVS